MQVLACNLDIWVSSKTKEGYNWNLHKQKHGLKVYLLEADDTSSRICDKK